MTGSLRFCYFWLCDERATCHDEAAFAPWLNASSPMGRQHFSAGRRHGGDSAEADQHVRAGGLVVRMATPVGTHSVRSTIASHACGDPEQRGGSVSCATQINISQRIPAIHATDMTYFLNMISRSYRHNLHELRAARHGSIRIVEFP
jgi:hypothetical protein